MRILHGTERMRFDEQSVDRLIEQINTWTSLNLDPKQIREEITARINEWFTPIAKKTPAVLLSFWSAASCSYWLSITFWPMARR